MLPDPVLPGTILVRTILVNHHPLVPLAITSPERVERLVPQLMLLGILDKWLKTTTTMPGGSVVIRKRGQENPKFNLMFLTKWPQGD
jgi:hypothetical protein